MNITIEEGIKNNGYHLSTIVGDSMMPLLRNRRDMVKIVPANGILKKYDLPLYRRPTGEYVLHRIVKVKKNYYVICGDNRVHREKVPFDWIIGVTESIYRDDMEVKVDNPEYVRYVHRVCRNYKWKRLAHIIKRIPSKIKLEK